MLSIADWLTPDPAHKQIAQAIAGAVFLLLFYASAPASAHFLAVKLSSDQLMLARLIAFRRMAPGCCPLVLYEHCERNANTVGIIPAYSKVYITTGLMNHLSDDGLRGILAHEHTHVQERHILITAVYASCYAMATHLTGSSHFFVFGFVVFLALRRQLEFRADSGGAFLGGKWQMTCGLQELNAIYPSKRWDRWVVFLTPYPTLPMRLNALKTGKRPLF